MSDTVLVVSIMLLGSLGLLALFVGLARVSFLLRKSERENRQNSGSGSKKQKGVKTKTAGRK